MKNAFSAGNILLPRDCDMQKWSVVACDQYTGEPEYWEETEKTVGAAPSALRLILPEVYLEESDVDKRIDNIHTAMRDYLSSDFFKEYRDSYIYIERTQSDGRVRAGLVGVIDLEQYDFHRGSTSPVRATEATVVERIPPRIKVRRGAPLELPHIMLLIDDEEKTVVEPIGERRGSLEKLYDFTLMQGGGSIKGWLLPKSEAAELEAALSRLSDPTVFAEKYSLPDKAVLAYAMGDGNHSLATAKEFYEELKRNNPGKDLSDHPARYALAELVNLHSPALEFEAIHRIVMGVDTEKLLNDMTAALSLSDTPSEQSLVIVNGESETVKYIHTPTSKLTVGSLQGFLDSYTAENGGKIDYIHGKDVTKRLSAAEGSIGFILPDMGKEELFPTVICDGALPRKTFSMGHAADKRFYIEARKITE